MKARIAMSVAIALSFGCTLQPAPTEVKAKPLTRPRLSPSPAAAGQPIPLAEPPRIIDTGTRAAELIGKVKIISDNGASIISNNGGNILGNNGGNLVSKVKYDVLQAAAPESLLADAQIEVLDAAGNVLVTAEQKPITATTDATGAYQLKANLPNENLILRVRLFNGGQLFAFTTKDQRTATLDIDTASSLGAAYVMEKYVKKSQAVLDKLPGLEAEKLRTEMEAARGGLSAVPSYQPQELVAAAETLRGQAPQVAEAIERIEALLLAGQSNLGTGLQATAVSLATPSHVVGDAAGNLYIAESTAGRIRKVAKDGTISVYVGPGAAPGRNSYLGRLSGLSIAPDGTLYAVGLTSQIVKIPPTGAFTVMAGNGQNAPAVTGGKATDTALFFPAHVTVGPDGLLYFCEIASYSKRKQPGRVLFIDAEGRLQAVPMPDGLLSNVDTFAVAPDGTIAIAVREGSGDQARRRLWRKKPGAAWEVQSELIDPAGFMIPAPDGGFCVSGGAIVSRVDAAGVVSRLGGNGMSGFEGDGGAATSARLNDPVGLWRSQDGTVYVADRGNGLVRAIGPDGTIRTVAGTRSVTQVGDAATVAISQPTAVVRDPQGRLVVAESAAHVLKRLDGTQLTVIAGGTIGYSGDGGPATAAQLNAPGGLAYHDGELYVLDAGNDVLRKIDKNGVITTLVNGRRGGPIAARLPADQAVMAQPFALAVSPDGIPYWTETLGNLSLILRLKDGFVEIVAGVPNTTSNAGEGDGGPATAAKLNSPSALAFDKAGNLYVSDAGSLRIRKIDKAGIITTVAGRPFNEVLTGLLSGQSQDTNGGPATESVLWLPLGLAFDEAGNLFVGEGGAAALSNFGEGLDMGGLPANLIPQTPARIRKITPDGKIYNITGPGTTLLAGDSGDDMLAFPSALAFDAQGRLVVSDGIFNQLKVLPKSSF